MASPHASSRLQVMQARFQQKQLQEKEQKLLQLYDQQQQRAHQVAQRGSAGSNTSNQGSTMNQTVTSTTSTTRTTSTSHGGKVRQMFDERRQTTVKGIDRSYPLEPLDNKPKKQITSNGFTPVKGKNISRHTVTTVKRTARADVNSNVNGGKPVVSYHEEVSRESYGDNQDDNEFANENDVGQYLNGNCQNQNELQSDDEETLERNQMISNIHLMGFDKGFQNRVVSDLESEQFPEDLMLEVPEKVPRKPISKKLSQAELRLERFKNSNANSKKNIVSRTTNSSVTRKRPDPRFPAQTTTRDSPPTKTRKRDQETSNTRCTPGKKRRDPSSSPTRDKKILRSRQSLETPESIELCPARFDNYEEQSSQVSTGSAVYFNQIQNHSELKSTFLIREVIQGSRPEINEDDKENEVLKIEESDEDTFKIEEIEDEPLKIEEEETEAWKQNQKKKSISGRESPRKFSKSGISRKFSIERTPSPAFKKPETESSLEENSKSHYDQFSFLSQGKEETAQEKRRELEKRRESKTREPEKRRESKTREPERRKESIKIKEVEKRRESKTKEPEKRRESIKQKDTEKPEEEIFIDDNCFRKRERKKIKDSIREKLSKDLQNVIKNRFILPVKKPVKKKSQDESRNVKINVEKYRDDKQLENKAEKCMSESENFVSNLDFSRGSSPEKVFERPSDYQEIIIEDQAIHARRRSTPSPLPKIKSRRESVEYLETISSAAKRKPSFEIRKLSGVERSLGKEKKIAMETENQIIEGKRKSIDLDKPLRSIQLVKQANKTKRLSLEEVENFSEEIRDHKIVKKQEAIFDISDELKEQAEESEMNDFEAKMREVEAKRREVENKMKEIETKKREVDTKIREVEEKQKEFEFKKLEVENKKKEVETKMKEIETKIKGIGVEEEEKIIKKEIKPVSKKSSSLQFDLKVRQTGRKSTEKRPGTLDRKKSIPKSEDEVDNIVIHKVVKEIEIGIPSKRILARQNSDEKFQSNFRTLSRTSPIPKVRRTSSKSESVKSPQNDKVKFEYKTQSEIDLENIEGFERTDSVESALRRFDSIGTDPDFDASKASCESIRKTPDSTKSKSEKSVKTKGEKSSKNLQIRKKSSTGTNCAISTPQRPIPVLRNQNNSRRISEDLKNVDYSRISTARDSIELTRNFIRARSPSCKRKLFVDSDSGLKRISSSKLSFDEDAQATSIFQEKLKVAERGFDRRNKGFLIENQSRQDSVRHFTNNEKTGKKSFEVSVRREIRRQVQNQSSCQLEESRVSGSGTFIKKGKNRGEIENVIVLRNTRSPSPDFGERKQIKSARPSTRRSVSTSPSKSPNSDLRRASAESKSSDLSIARRPIHHTPSTEESFQKEETSHFSQDVVDGPIFEDSHNPLETNEFETLEKKCTAFIVDIDDSTEVKKTPKKTTPRNERTATPRKSNSPTNPVTRPSSALSASSVGSAKTKMASKVRSAASRGSTPKSSGSIASRTDCNDSLVPCRICARRFASDRISLHEQICAKAGQKKRKQFDAMKFRVQGTELEPFVKNAIKKPEPKSKKPVVKSNWRKTHEEFINNIRAAKQVQAHLAAGGKLSDLPPPPPSDTSDYIQCPHCGRKFNQSAAERHIPKCQTMRHNKPNPRAPPKPRR
ncbi:trichohyalin-like isoform X1 [Belonocnema kinseyi]|uniref:trichohyalin-like isoform X1 n=1 Tax=Belonocnema kinseyi TaxID=2817044 RepID=UPI00143CC4E1|nr:trichohyalin-like isoform X1 [Belonocnema kinseyi]XP_033216749.1 trichohyalin-like isoform X1 [Belonocnema kinseyi]XP_033216750.1 trichohyalin-like isoform X1 [Belonocnema kinseyi]XP_033216751.1 trichohyalin-like isoform X1 [Belonocnema kinseyi]XP_033216752.1 trichohyalin-like isoform X1 [Belonocnema kinseyi]